MTDEKELVTKESKEENDPDELESQFILRLPSTPAASLRAAVRSGVMNLKDRLSIQIEPDMRHGTVSFDKWAMSAKIVDLPTLVESYKTLDRKTFYKAADICQLMACKEEGDAQKTDEESSNTKDNNDTKDKKYMLAHGITASLKNVRKRRFRKTLKKKCDDFSEIEKEVKRLLRMDNEAINVRYEVVNADDEKIEEKTCIEEFGSGNVVASGASRHLSKSQSLNVAEHDLFGEAVSSSEDDVNVEDLADDETSNMSAGPTTIYKMSNDQREPLVIGLSKLMLPSPGISDKSQDQDYSAENDSVAVSQLESVTAGENLGQMLKEQKTEEEKMALLEKLDELEHEIAVLQVRRRTQELEITSIENQALKERFQGTIDNLKLHVREKQREYDDIVAILHQL